MTIRLAAAALTSVILAATAVAPAAAQDRSSLTLGMALEPPHLDPTAGAAAAIDEIGYANIYEGLVRVDRTGAVLPALAESWRITDDGLTYTFDLVEGASFHDGTAFDAEDVKFSLERAMAEDSVNAKKEYFEPIRSVEVVDDDTVRVTLDYADGLFLFNMAMGDAVMVAPESADTNRQSPVGTGPFRFDRWVAGDRVVLTANPDYRDPAKPALERVTFRFISDPAAQVAALLSGDLDAFPNMGSYETLQRLEQDPRFVVTVGTTEGETILTTNNAREPFDDLRVRQALAHAIDRRALIDGAMFGYGTPIGSHFAPHHPAYVDLTGTYPHDPDKARELLAEAGYPEGFETTLALPPPVYARRGGEIIAAQLAEVGIEAEIIPVEWAQWLEQVFTNTDYDLTIVSHVEPLDIGIYDRDDYYFNYDSERFGNVMTALEGTTDVAERNRLYAEAQRIIAEDAVNGFLFQLPKTGVRNVAITGLWENSPVPANDVTEVHWE